MRGIDYSFSRPDIDCLWQQGYRFVVRYTSNGTSSKNATKPEIEALRARGFQIVIVHQNGTSDMLEGRAKGVHDASIAKERTAALGMPLNRPIFFALDRDPGPLSAGQIEQCREFLIGAGTVLGRNNVGLYAGFRGIELLCPTYARWGWQTYAWSGGRISSKAHFRQYRNGVNLCGGQVDLNESYAADFGQWPLAQPTPIPESEEDDDMPAARKIPLASTNPKRYAYVLPDGLVIDADGRGDPLVDGAGSVGAFDAVYGGGAANALQVDIVQQAIGRERARMLHS